MIQNAANLLHFNNLQNDENLNNNTNDDKRGLDVELQKLIDDPQQVHQLSEEEYIRIVDSIGNKSQKFLDSYINLHEQWGYYRAKGSMKHCYLFLATCKLKPKEIQCLVANNLSRTKLTFQYNSDSMGEEIELSDIITDIATVVNDDTYGVFWTGIIKSVWTRFLKAQENGDTESVLDIEGKSDYPPNNDALRLCINYFLTQCPMNETCNLLFNSFDESEFIDFSENKLGSIAKDAPNRSDAILYKYSDLLKQWNKRSDLVYDSLKKITVMSKTFFVEICKATMPTLWEKLIEGKVKHIQNHFKKLILRIISGECFKGYKETANKPTLSCLEHCQSELCHWLMCELTKSTPKKSERQWFVAGAHLSRKQRGDNVPAWIQHAHFPLLLGVLSPFLILNHYPFRRGETDYTVSSVATLLGKDYKLTYNCDGLITYLMCHLRQYMDIAYNNQGGAAANLSPQHYIHFFSLILSKSQKSVTWMYYMQWWKNQMHWLRWIYLQSIFKYPLGPQISHYSKSKGVWSNGAVWGGDIVLPPDTQQYELCIINTPLQFLAGVCTRGGAHTARLTTPLPQLEDEDKKILLIFTMSERAPGFDLLTHDPQGMRFDNREMRVVDTFCRARGLYPVMINNKYNAEQAWVSLVKNVQLTKGHRIAAFGLVQSPIDQHGETQSWLNRHMSKFDISM